MIDRVVGGAPFFANADGTAFVGENHARLHYLRNRRSPRWLLWNGQVWRSALLGRLDGITMLLRQELFLYMYVRKEADLSSRIKGTQSTLSDLFHFETEAQARQAPRYVSTICFGKPFMTSSQFIQKTGLSAPAVDAALADLERSGIVEEITGRKRERVFSFRQYLAILSEETVPFPMTT